MTKKIGLLGGIGPEATGTFYLNLIARLQDSGAIKSNTDFPQIIINSIPAPELIYEKISESEILPYLNGLRELERLDVDFIAMVCNTIYNYHAQLQKEIKTPIIDLKAEFAKSMKENNIRSIVVLATPSTMKGDLFRVEGVKYYTLDESDTKTISEAILLFNSGAAKEEQSRKLEVIAKKYLGNGAELAVLGCTEVSLMLKDSKIRKVNTMDILAKAVLDRI